MLSLASMRSSARSAGSMPARKSVRRWASAMTRLVVTSGIRDWRASRKRRSASAWCWSRRLRSAIQAPLSTNSRAGAAAARAVWGRRLGNERLAQIAIEARAQIGGKALDVAAEIEHRILGGAPRERAYGRADGLRLGPPALARPRFEPCEIVVVEVHLQRLGHDRSKYVIMMIMSTRS